MAAYVLPFRPTLEVNGRRWALGVTNVTVKNTLATVKFAANLRFAAGAYALQMRATVLGKFSKYAIDQDKVGAAEYEDMPMKHFGQVAPALDLENGRLPLKGLTVSRKNTLPVYTTGNNVFHSGKWPLGFDAAASMTITMVRGKLSTVRGIEGGEFIPTSDSLLALPDTSAAAADTSAADVTAENEALAALLAALPVDIAA